MFLLTTFIFTARDVAAKINVHIMDDAEEIPRPDGLEEDDPWCPPFGICDSVFDEDPDMECFVFAKEFELLEGVFTPTIAGWACGHDDQLEDIFMAVSTNSCISKLDWAKSFYGHDGAVSIPIVPTTRLDVCDALIYAGTAAAANAAASAVGKTMKAFGGMGNLGNLQSVAVDEFNRQVRTAVRQELNDRVGSVLQKENAQGSCAAIANGLENWQPMNSLIDQLKQVQCVLEAFENQGYDFGTDMLATVIQVADDLQALLDDLNFLGEAGEELAHMIRNAGESGYVEFGVTANVDMNDLSAEWVVNLKIHFAFWDIVKGIMTSFCNIVEKCGENGRCSDVHKVACFVPTYQLASLGWSALGGHSCCMCEENILAYGSHFDPIAQISDVLVDACHWLGDKMIDVVYMGTNTLYFYGDMWNMKYDESFVLTSGALVDNTGAIGALGALKLIGATEVEPLARPDDCSVTIYENIVPGQGAQCTLGVGYYPNMGALPSECYLHGSSDVDLITVRHTDDRHANCGISYWDHAGYGDEYSARNLLAPVGDEESGIETSWDVPCIDFGTCEDEDMPAAVTALRSSLELPANEWALDPIGLLQEQGHEYHLQSFIIHKSECMITLYEHEWDGIISSTTLTVGAPEGKYCTLVGPQEWGNIDEIPEDMGCPGSNEVSMVVLDNTFVDDDHMCEALLCDEDCETEARRRLQDSEPTSWGVAKLVTSTTGIRRNVWKASYGQHISHGDMNDDISALNLRRKPTCLGDSPAGWESSTGADCDYYEDWNFCKDGWYGSGWSFTSFGTFADWADDDGIDAGMACCVCGGGNLVWPEA